MFEVETVLGEQFTELGFKLDLFFQCSVALQCFQRLKLFAKYFPAYGIRQVSTLAFPDVCFGDTYLNSITAYKFIVMAGLSTYFPHSSFHP